MGSKVNSQQAPVHWLREITKAKLSQAKSFSIHIFLLKQWKKRVKFLTSLGKFEQVWASLGKLGQVSTRQQIIKMGKKAEKIRKGKKI